MLKLINIKKDYHAGDETVNALRGLNIDFRDKEFAVILGPSGCGKTTLMNIIGGLDRATSGELIINGKTTKNYDDSDWDDYRNKKIGFIFQNYNLINHLSVLGNVEIALTISGDSSSNRRRKAIEVLEKVGLADKLNKKPNQLSGGQMQRVAIARALVNDPEVLLADEPSGALDSETSTQIMDVIKEVFKDKLVIMVTHNPMIAARYATRVIKMLDGFITEDSNPIQISTNAEVDEKIKAKKSSMSYLTSLMLSWKNLITKKGRTILTSIAGSIGIIGIALILALSNGMNDYIARLQTDTLASNPITISESTINFTQAFNATQNQEVLDKFPEIKEVYVEEAINMNDLLTKNNINQEYLDYVDKNLENSLYSDIIYKTGLALNLYGKKAGQDYYSKLNEGSSGGQGSFGGSSSIWQMMLKTDFILSQYELLDGTFPSNSKQIVIIVSDTNQISETVLIALGLKQIDDNITKYSFAEVIGLQYNLVSNDEIYQKSGSNFLERSPLDINYDNSNTLEVVGILRIKETTDGGVLSPGIGYLKSLYEEYQNEQFNSEIISFMIDNPTLNPFTGLDYEDRLGQPKEKQREATFRSLGGELLPNEISIYPIDFEAKATIKKVLNDYNIGRDSDDLVTYTDMSELLGNTLTSVVNIISYVLIAFTAISLVVSSIMISIITYVSVLERTKEIGILRSVGARKKDVTRIFNAETIIIGFIAGVVGITVTYLLSIPINLIIKNLLGVPEIASLNIGSALILILISIVLTLISGLIPARKASKLDPVVALRTE